MDFRPNESQRELMDRVADFARTHLSLRSENALDRWKTLGEFGLLGLCVPEPYGGLGLDTLTTALAVEALGASCDDAGLVFSASAHLFACAMPIVEHGSDALKDRVVGRLVRGQWIGANAITEAEAGSDVFAMTTSAQREGDRYRLDGAKSYVTNGPIADAILVYAKTDPAAGHLGISAFVVERKTPGLSVGQPFQKMGLESSPIAPIYLDGCPVPRENLVGREGDGAAIFARSMLWERSCLFAAYLGSMQRQLEGVIAFATERRQFKRRISKNQAVAHRIVDMKLRLESARLLLYRACWLRDQGDDATLDVSLAKLAVSEAAIHSGLDSIFLHGGAGYLVEAGVERFLRDAIPAAIFSGTSEIQRDLIAQRLGL